jgi:DNA-directed RNA polymerase sigma subunit (sigma70/sigma32)
MMPMVSRRNQDYLDRCWQRWEEVARMRKEGTNLAAIAKHYGISRERVRQIMAKAARRAAKKDDADGVAA